MVLKEIEKHTGDPLYCFKLNEDGSIKRIKIRDWDIRTWAGYSNRCTIRFDNKKFPINNVDKWYRVDNAKLERFVSNKLFTFNGEQKDAEEVMLETLNSKMNEMQEMYNSYKATFDSIVKARINQHEYCSKENS